MTSPASRQLILGLDAAEWHLVRRWADAGELPTFRQLLQRGASGPLTSTAHALPDTVWSCLYTGLNPAWLEKYFYIQYDAETQGLRHVHDDVLAQPPFWKVLSDAGLRVGVVDAVKFPLCESLNGFMLANWGAHATKTARASTPGPLLAEIERRFGPHPVGDCDAFDQHPGAQSRLLQRLIEGVRLRGKLNQWLMQSQDWDVYFAGFSELHCAGHHFWRWLDPDRAADAAPKRHGLGDALLEVYRAVDREMRGMLDLAGRGTRCMIVSGHGMGPLHNASWNLQEILDLLGFGSKEPARAPADRTAHQNFWRTLKRLVPGRLQYAVKACLPTKLQDELLFRWYAGRRDWRGCRAFAVPNNDSVGAIRIALAGRDRHGIVPAAQYEALCREIAASIEELTDPETGRRVVLEVCGLRDRYRGPLAELLPDLTVLWDSSFPWSRVHSPRFGTLRIDQRDRRTGTHTSHGFAILDGAGTPAGALSGTHSTFDIAPTILQHAGVEVPAAWDGRAIMPCSASALV